MSTRSYIAYEDLDGTVKGIFCHYDGYLEHNGRILFDHYNSLERAKKLVKLGSLDFLGAYLEPSEYIKLYGFDETKNKKAFQKLPVNVQIALRYENNKHTTAYYRDYAKYLTPKEQENILGEYMQKPKIDTYKSMNSFLNEPSNIIGYTEYLYIYSGKTWKVYFYNEKTEKEYKGSLKRALHLYTKEQN